MTAIDLYFRRALITDAIALIGCVIALVLGIYVFGVHLMHHSHPMNVGGSNRQ